MKLNALAAKILASYPLKSFEAQLEGDVSLQLPARIIEDALVVRLHRAKSEKPEYLELRDEYPAEFNVDIIKGLLTCAREKLREEEKAVSRVQGE